MWLESSHGSLNAACSSRSTITDKSGEDVKTMSDYSWLESQ
jgi:hypothetical protein